MDVAKNSMRVIVWSDRVETHEKYQEYDESRKELAHAISNIDVAYNLRLNDVAE